MAFTAHGLPEHLRKGSVENLPCLCLREKIIQRIEQVISYHAVIGAGLPVVCKSGKKDIGRCPALIPLSNCSLVFISICIQPFKLYLKITVIILDKAAV